MSKQAQTSISPRICLIVVGLVTLLQGCGGFMKVMAPEPVKESRLFELEPMPAAIAPEQSMPEPLTSTVAVPAIVNRPKVKSASNTRSTTPTPAIRNGKFFQYDGPGDIRPSELQNVAEPIPRHEPLADYANKPYAALGKAYAPAKARKAMRQRGIASWYGRQFHGRKTSIGERYDMYAISAAHPTLPLPSFVRVTNLANKRSIVVRVNDRGPFTAGRMIDLSYAAASKLGFTDQGSTVVEMETIIPRAEAEALSRPPPSLARAS